MEISEYELITLIDGGFVTNVVEFSKYFKTVIRDYFGGDNIISD